MYFKNYGLQITCIDKFLKSSTSEDPSTSNMVNGPKHCWNLRDSTFIIFIDKCKRNWVGKKSLLVICKILGLFVETLPADYKYSFLNRDNLTQSIQMQLSK